MISFDRHLGEPTLTRKQVHQLSCLVEAELLKVDPTIVAPRARDYCAEVHWQPWNYFGLSVDIDVGSTVLTLREGLPYGSTAFAPDVDLRHFAKGAASVVSAVRNDSDGLERLWNAQRAAELKIKRENLKLDLLSVRFAPVSFSPNDYRNSKLWVRIGMFDNMLRPTVQLIDRDTPRTICKELSRLGKKQAARLSMSDRLAPINAVLEIDDVAEHAILATGHSLKDIVGQMVPADKRGRSPIVLWGDPNQGDHVSVACRDGRIELDAQLPSIWWKSGREIIVWETFPYAITYGLGGRPLSALVEHPFILGSAVIAEASQISEYATQVTLHEKSRPIYCCELDVPKKRICFEVV